MSESQEAVSVERFPSLRGAEALFLIMKNGPMTTEQMRQSLGYGTHAGVWRHMNMLCLSSRFALVLVDGRWGLKDQFEREMGNADSV